MRRSDKNFRRKHKRIVGVDLSNCVDNSTFYFFVSSASPDEQATCHELVTLHRKVREEDRARRDRLWANFLALAEAACPRYKQAQQAETAGEVALAQ